MSVSAKITALDVSELDLFQKQLNELYPNVLDSRRLTEWKGMSKEKRKERITTFLEEKKYSEETLKTVYKTIAKTRCEKNKRKLRVYSKRIGYPLLGLLVVAVIYFYYVFTGLDRVYAIGNGVIPVDSKTGTVVPELQMDLFGKSYSDSLGRKSKTTMLFEKTSDAQYEVMPDDFFGWLLGSKRIYLLDSATVTREKLVYNNYRNIFSEFDSRVPQNDSLLVKLSVRDRAEIYNLIVNRDVYRGYTVSALPSEKIKSTYEPFLSIDKRPDYVIFLSLRKGASFVNIRMIYSETFSAIVDTVISSDWKYGCDKQFFWKKGETGFSNSNPPIRILYNDGKKDWRYEYTNAFVDYARQEP